jgi:hypothetical protein
MTPVTSPLAAIGMDSNFSQFMARQRIESQINLPRLFAAIDADPAIVGAGVVYIDADFNVVVLREFRPICSIAPKRVILREAKPYLAPQQFIEQVKNSPRESRLGTEVANAGLSCLSAYIGWSVVLAGSIAVPFTAGASAWVVALGVTAAAAGTAQCAIGGMRVVNELNNPQANDEMNDAEWYKTVAPILDGVSLAGVGGSAMATVRLLKASKASGIGKSWYQLLSGLNRQERAKLTKELLMLRDPSLTAKLLKLQQRAGALPKRFASAEIRHATITQIKDSLGALLTVTGSYTGDGHVKNATTIAVGLYEEFHE